MKEAPTTKKTAKKANSSSSTLIKDNLNIDLLTVSILKKNKITKVNQLAKIDKDKLLSIKGIGSKTVDKIVDEYNKYQKRSKPKQAVKKKTESKKATSKPKTPKTETKTKKINTVKEQIKKQEVSFVRKVKKIEKAIEQKKTEEKRQAEIEAKRKAEIEADKAAKAAIYAELAKKKQDEKIELAEYRTLLKGFDGNYIVIGFADSDPNRPAMNPRGDWDAPTINILLDKIKLHVLNM